MPFLKLIAAGGIPALFGSIMLVLAYSQAKVSMETSVLIGIFTAGLVVMVELLTPIVSLQNPQASAQIDMVVWSIPLGGLLAQRVRKGSPNARLIRFSIIGAVMGGGSLLLWSLPHIRPEPVLDSVFIYLSACLSGGIVLTVPTLFGLFAWGLLGRWRRTAFWVGLSVTMITCISEILVLGHLVNKYNAGV